MRVLLGRESRSDFHVVVRCPFGAPAVVDNEPRDRAGRPFPTRHWLTCRALVEAVSRLEAAGGVRALEDDRSMRAPLAAAHAAHAALHEGHRIAGVGAPERVKCLHAQLAFALASGGGAIADWIGARTDLAWPARCCLERLRRIP